jgi:hypothetical protein
LNQRREKHEKAEERIWKPGSHELSKDELNKRREKHEKAEELIPKPGSHELKPETSFDL